MKSTHKVIDEAAVKSFQKVSRSWGNALKFMWINWQSKDYFGKSFRYKTGLVNLLDPVG